MINHNLFSVLLLKGLVYVLYHAFTVLLPGNNSEVQEIGLQERPGRVVSASCNPGIASQGEFEPCQRLQDTILIA